MKTYLSLLSLLSCASVQLLSQDSTSQFSYELSGGFSYSYSNSLTPPYSGESFSRYFKTHTVSISPSLGYFLTEEIEILLSPEYSLQIVQYNLAEYRSGNPIIVIERTDRRTGHRIGFSLGIAYNYYLTSTFDIFVGAKIGQGWTWTGSQTEYFSWNTGWSKPELSFPQVVAGVKIFIATSWAFLLQGQYSFTDHYSGNPEQEISRYVFAVGMSTFL